MENILEYVKEKWEQLTAFSKKEELKEQLWEEIVYQYSAQHRHYHNLSHIEQLFRMCDTYMDRIKYPGLIGFAIFYHDIVYDTYMQDNEEQSAALAEVHLKQLNVNPRFIENVQTFIRATKNHEIPEDYPMKDDLSLFLDFDISILATDEETYKRYSDNIRQEYSKYSDGLYKQGRKHALQRILAAENIFSSQIFKEQEEKARQNINREIGLL